MIKTYSAQQANVPETMSCLVSLSEHVVIAAS